MLYLMIEVRAETDPFVDHSDRQFLLDLLAVGPNKPIGYLSFLTIGDDCMVDVDDLISYLQQTGRQVVIFKPTKIEQFMLKAVYQITMRDQQRYESSVAKATRLYAYDTQAVQKIIDDNVVLLQNHRWPTTVTAFVKKLATTVVENSSPLKAIVDHCFEKTTPSSV